MKLLLSIVLAASLSITSAIEVLPPGYEDEMWCPPDDCKIYSNPFGISGGPSSSFYFCYSNSTANVTDAVWTGNLTDVTEPADWQEPEDCSADVYSECDYDEDCILTVRTSIPVDVDLSPLGHICSCFADSVFHPFDQCEGRSGFLCLDDDEVTCGGNPCQNYYGECVIGDNGAGACVSSWKYLRTDDDDTTSNDDVSTKRPTRRPTRKPSRKPSR